MNNNFTPMPDDMKNEAQQTNTTANAVMKKKFDSSKLVRLLIPAVFFVIPAVIITIYAILEATDVLPPRIYIGNTRFRFVGLFETDFMIFMSVISYLLCPFIGIAILVNKILRIREEAIIAEAESEPFPAKNSIADLYREPEASVERTDVAENESLQYTEPIPAVVDEPVAEEVLLTQANAEGQESSENIGEQTEASEEPKIEIIPERPTAFEYSRLGFVDASTAFVLQTDYTKSFAFDELCSNFVGYLESSGIAMPDTVARRFFSAMAASKCIWISGKNRDVIRKTVNLIGEYFGQKISIENIADMQYSTTDLALRYVGNGEFKESDFLVDVYSTNYYPKRISFAALLGDFKNVGESFDPYIKNSDVKGRNRSVEIVNPITIYGQILKYANGNRMSLPSNLWYIIITDDASCSGMPNGAVAVDFGSVAARESAESEEKNRIIPAYEDFLDLVRRNKDERYIAEEYWKKLDAVEEYVERKTESFRLDNKAVRAIERYAAVCLSMNGTLYEALDGVVAGMILPALADCERDSISGNEDGISVLIDRIFGMDNMPFTHEIIRKFGVD